MTDNLIFSSLRNAYSFNCLCYTSFVWDWGGVGWGRRAWVESGGGGGGGGHCLYFSPGSSSLLCLEELEVGKGRVSLWVAMLRVIVFMLYL